jgi:hypothetical protein
MFGGVGRLTLDVGNERKRSMNHGKRPAMAPRGVPAGDQAVIGVQR